MKKPAMKPRPNRIIRAQAGLLVVDVQERLLPVISDRETVLENALRLVRGAQVFRLPVWVTEQYPKGLGPTVPELSQALAGAPVFDKLSFSAAGVAALLDAFHTRGVTEIVLCGVESHVCVAQTCLDLLDAGLRPFVVADAVSSRTALNRQIGLERMRDAGAQIVSTEMILFELLDRAGTAEFKEIQRLVK
jgi:nicotinamidase-related amidase